MQNTTPMIRLEHLCKIFNTGKDNVEALRDVSLDIEKGEIQGIIGFSGAGKSTLVRCINLLERPTSGKVFIGERELTAMSEKELRAERKKIGMIFQSFNLMKSRTIYSNVAFPLKGTRISQKQEQETVMRLLKIVGLENRANAYPSELSGGQKQRVAIARAMASNPPLLLCDEATSALDPQTTQDILKLLKKLNKELGVTIVVITHEMAVVKEICSRVAVMEDGRIVESGDIYSVFADPKMPITKRFISTADGIEHMKQQLMENGQLHMKPGNQLIQLDFRGESSGDAIVSQLSRDCNIDISIVYGNVEILAGKPLGKLICVFSGLSDSIETAKQKLEQENVRTEVLARV